MTQPLTHSIKVALVSTPLLLSTACIPSVISDYEAARDEALASPGQLPKNWKPDTIATVSLPLINELVTALVDEHGATSTKRTIDGPLGIKGTVTPNLALTGLSLSESKTCSSCLTVNGDLSGDVGWAVGPIGETFPIDAHLNFDMAFNTEKKGKSWAVKATPSMVSKLDIKIAGLDGSLRDIVNTEVNSWISKELLKKVPSFTVLEIDTTTMPLRAIDIQANQGGLEVGLLTQSPTPGLVSAPKPPSSGWALAISQDSLLDIAKAMAFENGPVGYDVVVEPTALAVNNSDFKMGVRLWRIDGKGWWRDYDINGTISYDAKDGLDLKPGDVTEGEKSPGAVFVDPLAALAEGKILEVIETTIAMTIPLSKTSELGGLDSKLSIESITGDGEALSLSGNFDLKKKSKESTKPPKTGGEKNDSEKGSKGKGKGKGGEKSKGKKRRHVR